MFYVVTFKYKEDDIYSMCVTHKLNLCNYDEAYAYDDDAHDEEYDYECEEYIYDYETAKKIANKMKKLYPQFIIKVESIGEINYD